MENELIALGFQFGLPVLLLIVCYGTGRWVERRHFERLEIAEAELKGILVSTQKHLPQNWHCLNHGELVSGNVVIATDHFKVFVSWFKSLFGGNLTEFETLLERARREAIVRMMREAQAHGANVIWNCRIETVFMGDQAQRPSGAEIVAYGTAFRMR